MTRFKVLLAESDGNALPAWVAETLAQADIEFVVANCRTTAELVEHAADADLVWVWGSHVVTAESLALLPKLGALIRTGSGTDNVPVAAATQRGIVVAHTPQAHNDAVSDHAIGLLFAVMRHITELDRSVRAGEWRRTRGAAWHLHDQTLGLVGFGHAARLVTKKLRGFDLTMLVHDPYLSTETLKQAGVRPATLDEVLAESDFVFLHCPLTEQTHHLIGERELRLMKPTAILINTARGPVVDEPALVRALTEGWIAAAGTDVFEQEPPAPDNPLFKLDNVVLTPHTAGQSDEDRDLAFRLSVDTAVAIAQGRWPRSYVNHGVQPRWPLA